MKVKEKNDIQPLEIEIFFNTIHNIDLKSNFIKPVKLDNNSEDIKDYIKLLIKGIRESKNTRLFELKLNSSLKKEFLNVNSSKTPQLIADKLFKEEKTAQKKYVHLTTIQKGSLLQASLLVNNKKVYIITKIDLHKYLDENELKTRVGLPFEKQVLKACIIEFEESSITKISICDTKEKIAEYWVNDFLELIEINSDETNTLKAFKNIDSVLIRNVKDRSGADYTFLRNNVVSYFKTHAQFQVTDFVENVIGTYKPQKLDVKIENLKEKISNLPSNSDFDSTFNIIESKIKHTFKHTIQLSEKLDLFIKDEVENLGNIIESFIDSEGNKCLKIKSEKGYNFFNTDETK